MEQNHAPDAHVPQKQGQPPAPAPATPPQGLDPRPTGPASDTARNNAIKKAPWATICWVIFFGALFGSCNGMMKFREQQQTRQDQEFLTKQEADLAAQTQQAENAARKLDAISATASGTTKERLAKIRECVATTPPSFQDDAIKARSQFWLHYCLTGKPPNFKID